MQLGTRLLFTIAVIVVSAIHAQQINPTLCPDGAIEFVDPSWSPVPSRFEIMTELVTGNDVAELSQAFSSQRDAIVFTSKGSKLPMTFS
jgi:hypothetical protein